MAAQQGRAHREVPPAPRVTYLVKRLELAVRSEMEAIVGELGITALQYTALSVLARHPGMSGAQLARRSFVSPQAGSEMVAVLERKGLISRAPHRANRRVLCIELSPTGRRLLARCDRAVDHLERHMLEGFDARRMARLRTDLDACVDALSGERPGDRNGSVGAAPRSPVAR